MAKHFDTTPAHAPEPRAPRATWTDVLVCAVTCVLMCGALALWGLKECGVTLPVWLDGETANHLAGAVYGAPWPESLAEVPEAFSKGELQEAFDTRITQNIPARAVALMGNTALQRSAIKASNTLFRWPAYPTYYGSNYFYFDEFDALLPAPLTNMTDGWEDFGTQIAGFAERHPDVEFLVYVSTESSDADVNPVYAYREGADSIEDFGAILEDTLQSSSNVRTIVEDFSSPDDYYELYFKSDNHWTILGAEAGYNRIAEEMGLPALEVDGTKELSPRYLGSWSRLGLADVTDAPTDIDEDFSDLTITTTNNVYNGNDHSSYDEATELFKAINFVQEYYNLFGIYSTDGIVSIDSALVAPEDCRPTIVVCDSYGYQSGRMLARGFGHVDLRYWLYVFDEGDQRLEDTLAETGDKTVVFLAAPQYYSTFLSRHPHFFE